MEQPGSQAKYASMLQERATEEMFAMQDVIMQDIS
jgi:hypothetical protein